MGEVRQSGEDQEVLLLNLYAHFPFCRRKCTYCALHSYAGTSTETRAKYVSKIANEIASLSNSLSTVYFGGGSPALCDLEPILKAINPLLSEDYEFTVELHPLDVSHEVLETLKAGGVNRISMGVQSLDDAVLSHMGRGYTFDKAEKAFATIKEHFDNAGIDLIVGYPNDSGFQRIEQLASWGLMHCSVYSLILEERSRLAHHLDSLALPPDDVVLDNIRGISRFLSSLGLRRYEISNYAIPGFECRHNMAVWRGEDYIGIGEGAYGRIGLDRIESGKRKRITSKEDELERRLFRLRTIEGLDPCGHPEWISILEKFASENILEKCGTVYILTERGTEVCDSILAELV